MDLETIYAKIAPYLEKPEFIRNLLQKHSERSIEDLKGIIESEMENIDTISRTDLRILLNSIDENQG